MEMTMPELKNVEATGREANQDQHRQLNELQLVFAGGEFAV